uniref:Uncharacterized protein n=1 Tax=Oryza brachyantha TaxID=4533 RepID=J3MJ42_ORYBR
MALAVDLELLLDDDAEREEEDDEERGGGAGVGGAGEGELPLHDDHDEEVAGEADGDVEEAEERVAARLLPAAAARVRHDPYRVDEHHRHRRRQPRDEQDQRLGVVAVERQVELRVHGAAEADEPLQIPSTTPRLSGKFLT